MSLLVQEVEAELVGWACSSDPAEAHAAFSALYERHADDVFTFLDRFLSDRSLAEDALQETFLRVHRHLPEHDAQRSFRGWVFRIARNVAVDLYRRQRKQDRVTSARAEQVAALEEAGPLDRMARQEDQDLTRAALEALSPEDRALLMQRHVHRLKLAELAVSFDCTERTVRNRLRSAAARLTQAVLARKEWLA